MVGTGGRAVGVNLALAGGQELRATVDKFHAIVFANLAKLPPGVPISKVNRVGTNWNDDRFATGAATDFTGFAHSWSSSGCSTSALMELQDSMAFSMALKSKPMWSLKRWSSQQMTAIFMLSAIWSYSTHSCSAEVEYSPWRDWISKVVGGLMNR